jgi:hypothetical protein
MEIEVGVCMTALSLDSFTTNPPVGAEAVSVTVPVDELPPTTDIGFKLIDDTLMLFRATKFCPDPK